MPDARKVSAIMQDYRQADLSQPERAMLDFAVQLTRSPQQMSPRHLDELRKLGFDEEAILEIVHIVTGLT